MVHILNLNNKNHWNFNCNKSNPCNIAISLRVIQARIHIIQFKAVLLCYNT